jgi:hypothetical protein
MHIWIAFDARDPLGEKFSHKKEYLGVSSKAEVQKCRGAKRERQGWQGYTKCITHNQAL